MRESMVQVTTIEPGAIDRVAIGAMLSDTLRIEPAELTILAEEMYRHTHGNPFFLSEFLRNIYKSKLLINEDGWRWDIEAIRKASITENVVALVAGNIASLPAETRQLLMVASVLGNTIALEMIGQLMGEVEKALYQKLAPAIQEGMILQEGGQLSFLHDNVRAAAYSLLSEDERIGLHYRAGQFLLDSTSASDLPEQVFSIVNQLNLGRSRIAQKEEKDRLLQLNLIAGRRARASSAFDAALQYFIAAMELLPADAWEKDYPLAYSLYVALAEARYIATDFDEAAKLFEKILIESRGLIDRMRVYELQFSQLTVQNRFVEAIEKGRIALRQLGVRVPQKPGKFSPVSDLLRAKIKIGKKIETLVDLPEMEDQEKIAAMRMLIALRTPAFIAQPALFPVIVLKAVHLSLKFGRSPLAADAFVCLGMIMGSGMGDYAKGYRLGRMAHELIKKYSAGDTECRVLFFLGNMINDWSRSAREGQSLLLESYQRGVEAGELQFASYALNWHNFHEFFVRKPLVAAAERFDGNRNSILRLQQKDAVLFYDLWNQFVLKLASETFETNLHGSLFDESKVVGHWIETNNHTCLFCYHLHKCILSYAAGEFKEALAESRKAAAFAGGVFGMPVNAELNFFQSLSLSACASERTKESIQQISRNQKQLGIWRENAPMNFEHKFLLIEAELQRLRGNRLAAADGYEAAIRSARTHGYILEEALSNELAGRFHLARASESTAETFLRGAVRCYSQYGMRAREKALQREFPVLAYVGPASADKTSSWSSSMSTEIDLTTVVKSTQALSGEIFLDRLLDRVMRITIENAGAQRGALITEKDGRQVIVAEGAIGKNDIQVLRELSVESDQHVSAAIVQYVRRTAETVVLADAHAEGPFVSSPYIARNKSRSVLCTPLVVQGKTIAILYLENNVTSSVFTQDRLALLRILATQAAISLENARLIVEENQRQKLRRELELARDVQMSSLPVFPEDDVYKITAVMRPAESVGGDYYDYVRVGSDRWLAIGDVTGHGLNSGLMMLMAQTGFSTYLNTATVPDTIELFAALNQTLHANMRERTKQDLYMTLTTLRADDNGNFEHVGKHEDILIWRNGSGKVQVVKSEGMWMGLLPDVREMLVKSTFKLDAGDFVTLFTDGVIECRNAAREQFDTKRLIQLIEENANQGIEAVKQAIVDACFAFMSEQDDDLTLLIMQKK